METIDRLNELNDSLSIAVISDLHAFDKNNYSGGGVLPSFLDMSLGESMTKIHPISALKVLIEGKEISADILVCAGDMADKANPSAIQYAWNKLQELKVSLNARALVSTPGNHDHDSRSHYCSFDPRGALQKLSPKFPFQKKEIFNEFWAKNYSIISQKLFRLIVLNSSAFHGISEEFRHGRISEYTLESIEADLKITKQAPINILLCHHHPHRHEGIDLPDFEVMAGGQRLTQLLGSGQYGNWVIIHGHKHFPNISYSQGGSGGPVVFSAGSLCGFVDPKIASKAKNQFYIINFEIESIKKFGFVGTFNAWDWVNGDGWKKATENSGLPCSGGFGYRTQIDLVADKINSCMGDKLKENWDSMLSAFPNLKYLTPGDLKILENNLYNRHALKLVKSSEGLIIQIGKTT